METRVAVQQQQRLLREGLGHLLEAEDDLELCGTAAGAYDLLRLCADRQPHLVLLEADASAWDVAGLCRTLRGQHSGVRLVGLVATPLTPAERSEAKRCGMTALVSRATGIAGVLASMRAAAKRPSTQGATSVSSPATRRTRADQVMDVAVGD